MPPPLVGGGAVTIVEIISYRTVCQPADGERLMIPYIHAKHEKKTSLDRQEIGWRYGSLERRGRETGISCQTPESVWSSEAVANACKRVAIWWR
jgi:hypothetical protein